MKIKVTALVLSIIMLFSCVFVSADEGTNLYNYINQAINYISESYKFGVDTETLKDIALREFSNNPSSDLEDILSALLSSLDPNSSYLTKSEYQNLYAQSVSGRICGIGVRIQNISGKTFVSSVIKNSPAERAGVLANDIIIGINGEDVSQKTIAEIQERVLGEEGKPIIVTFLRGEDTVTLEMVRAWIKDSYVDFEIKEGIGILTITNFNSTTTEEVLEALSHFDKNGVGKILLDLRSNPGGNLETALDLCRIFAPKGVIARVEYNEQQSHLNTLFYSENEGKGYKMAVLVNEGSASASELLSGTLSDTSVAKIFGKPTYGKGTVQVLRPLVTGGAIRLTVAEYKTSGARTIHGRGVKPDVIVENTKQKLDTTDFISIKVEQALKEGDSGEGVFALEQRLEALGYMDNADTLYDDETENAVQTFQLYAGLTATGVADVYTLIKLNDIEYDTIEVTVDNQMQAALDYLKG